MCYQLNCVSPVSDNWQVTPYPKTVMSPRTVYMEPRQVVSKPVYKSDPPAVLSCTFPPIDSQRTEKSPSHVTHRELTACDLATVVF